MSKENELTLADHAELWWQEMYRKWVDYAFGPSMIVENRE